MIVIDSSVVIGLLRGHGSAAVERLKSLEREGTPFFLPGICYQEILQGAKDEREWSLLTDYLGSQDLLFPIEPGSTHREAARIFFDCRRRGLTVRSSMDCFIAQLVLEHKGVLLHNDEDFERIRQVRPLRTLRS